MYCEYWNLHKAPFDNVPDPSMYTICHTSMEQVIADTIFAIKEANEAFAVIIGTAGSGKTLSLRIIMDSLESDKFKIVTITNPEVTFTQLLKEIIGQLTAAPCEENRKILLLEIFRRLLRTMMDHGQKVVIFIDEANALSPANLENLRLLTNMQDDRINPFTLVLAGQMELAQRLEHPKRANLFQRIGSYCRIDKLTSPEAVKTYIEDRLKLAGTTIKIFSDDSIPVIWECSEHGIPRLINKICKLCLKDGQTCGVDYVSADLVSRVAQRFQKLSKTAVQKRKSRNRSEDADISHMEIAADTLEEKAMAAFLPVPDLQSPTGIPSMELKPEREINQPPPAMDSIGMGYADHSFGDESFPEKTLNTNQNESGNFPSSEIFANKTISETTVQYPLHPVNETAQENVAESLGSSSSIFDNEEKQPEASTLSANCNFEQPHSENTLQSGVIHDMKSFTNTAGPTANEIPSVRNKPSVQDETGDEITIGEHKIHLDIPKDILRQVKSFNLESANKSAGFWAAQIIKKNPQLISSPLADPVHIWNEIKDNILKRIAQ